jgi:hypothetical protein
MTAGAAGMAGVPKLPSRSSVAPERKKLRQGAVLGAVRQLLQGVGVQVAGCAVLLVGEHRVVEKRRGPTKVAGVKGLLGDGDDPVDPADRVDIAGGEFGPRVRPQPGRVAVEPAEVALVDGLDVVTD